MPENVTFIQNRAYGDPNKKFQGREETLEDMDKALLPTPGPEVSSAPRSYVLHGPAGIGKTQTAAHYFHTRRKHFDAAFWVQATSKDNLSGALDQISERLGMYHRGPSQSAKMTTHRGSHVVEWLRNPEQSSAKTSKRLSWLLVFDNVDNEEVLKDFWPYRAPGSVIVTTRLATMYDIPISSTASAELRPLDIPDAVELLKSKIPGELLQNETDEDLQRVVEILGHWPLAIAHMSGQMKYLRKPPSIFLKHCESSGMLPRRYIEGAPPLRDGYEDLLSILWSPKATSPMANRLLSVLSLLMPEEILEPILICFQPEQGGIALEGYPKSRIDYDFTMAELVARSDISFMPTAPGKPGAIHIHSFVQQMIRSHLLLDPGRMCETFKAVVELLLNVWPHEARPQHSYVEPNEKSKWAAKDELIPHLSHMRQMYDLLPDRATKLECATEGFLLLLWEVGRYATFVHRHLGRCLTDNN